MSNIDHLSEIGARRLAARLCDFWKSRGHDVTVRVERVVVGAGDKPFAIYCVRSDLAAGPPRPKAAAIESTAA
jgi:hypothetical protein